MFSGLATGGNRRDSSLNSSLLISAEFRFMFAFFEMLILFLWGFTCGDKKVGLRTMLALLIYRFSLMEKSLDDIFFKGWGLFY
jgi:hypothetical protein